MLQVWQGKEKFLHQNIKTGNLVGQPAKPGPEADEDQIDRSSTGNNGQAHSNHLGLLEDWHDDQEATDEEEHDGEDQVDSDRSLEVRLFPPEIENTEDWESDEEWIYEGGEVDEDEDVRGDEEGEGDDAEHDQAGDGCDVFDVDQSHTARHVSVTSSNKKQSRGGEYPAVDSSECAAGHEERNDPSHHAEHFVPEGDRHGAGGEDLGWREDGEVGDVGEEVDDGDEGEGDVDGSRQVLVWLLQLLRDKVETIPASKAEETRVEGESNPAQGTRGALHTQTSEEASSHWHHSGDIFITEKSTQVKVTFIF